MTTNHPDIGPELRALAQAILDRLDPAVRIGAAMAAGGGPGKCQQVWCPVCALAALINGEQHPLLTVIAEHSVALVTMIRAMVTEAGPEPGPDGTSPPESPAPGSGSSSHGGYQPIPISVEE